MHLMAGWAGIAAVTGLAFALLALSTLAQNDGRALTDAQRVRPP
jgi:hypothetical protein